jgi:hypothetical protein
MHKYFAAFFLLACFHSYGMNNNNNYFLGREDDEVGRFLIVIDRALRKGWQTNNSQEAALYDKIIQDSYVGIDAVKNNDVTVYFKAREAVISNFKKIKS